MAIALAVKEVIVSTYSVADLTATTQGARIQAIGEISSEAVAAQLMEIRDAISTVLDKEPQPARVGLTSSGAEDLNDPTIQALGYFSEEHLPLLYGGAEVFVFPSLAEGFGLPVLEAMACGTPVICSDTTALPEIAGGAACLVPALEVEAWTEMIDSVLFDSALRERMSTARLRRAAEFSWKRTADIVRKVLATV